MPVLVPGNHAFLKISTGRDYTCAIDTGGALWCWKVQAGYGEEEMKVLAPLQVGKDRTFVAVSTLYGYSSSDLATYACALDVSDVVLCFGKRPDGQHSCTPVLQIRQDRKACVAVLVFAGADYSRDGSTPVTVASDQQFLSLGTSSGGQHTCAIATRAVTGEGSTRAKM